MWKKGLSISDENKQEFENFKDFVEEQKDYLFDYLASNNSN